VNDKRRYQRYAVDNKGNITSGAEIIVGGGLVRLVDFSLSGLCVLSKLPFSLDKAVSISVEFENRGEIDLIGKITRVEQEGDMWLIAIDLTEAYKLDTLKKV
jgi:hypothetical protein